MYDLRKELSQHDEHLAALQFRHPEVFSRFAIQEDPIVQLLSVPRDYREVNQLHSFGDDHILKSYRCPFNEKSSELFDRSVRSIDLLQQKFGDLVPQTAAFMEEGNVYILQEMVKGSRLGSINSLTPAQQSDLDQLICRSLDLWEETHRAGPHSDLPNLIDWKRVTVKSLEQGEGIFLDFKLDNIMVGEIGDSPTSVLRYVDTGLYAIHAADYVGRTPQAQILLFHRFDRFECPHWRTKYDALKSRLNQSTPDLDLSFWDDIK